MVKPLAGKPIKKRRRYQHTSAAGIAAYLHRLCIDPVSCKSDVHDGEWVVIVNCKHLTQTTVVWNALRQGGYNLLGQWHLWVIVAERQDAEVGA